MGLFSRMRGFTGAVPKELLRDGLLGRGIVFEVVQTGVSVGEVNPDLVCDISVEVMLDNVPRYTAKCRQGIPTTVLPQLTEGQAMVAVRVNPRDHNEIALSLGEEPPTVTMAAGEDEKTDSAADILENGEPCRAVIVQAQPLGARNPAGDEVYAFVLTVMADGEAPYQVQVGNAVPAAGVPLIYPGSAVPAKRIPERGQECVVVDWAAAVDNATRGSG
jgi:hypothetical protein